MPKRISKRKRAVSVERVPNENPGDSGKNPFLSGLECEDSSILPVNRGNNHLLLQHVFSFSESSSKRNIGGAFSEASLTFLLDVLEQDLPGAISHVDIALLILEWSIRRILAECFSSDQGHSAETNLLVWRAAFVTLLYLNKTEDASVKYTISQQILTQSTLYKLCPYVALYAITRSGVKDSSDSKNQFAATRRHAGSFFSLLANELFRPTLDVATKCLLIPIAERLNVQEASQSVVNEVISASLRLLLTLHLSRKGNAKTTFQLFSSLTTMLALAKVYFYLQAEASTAPVEKLRKSEGEGLLIQLLSDALFNPRHHMEGFYSLLHKMELPVFQSGKDALVDETKTPMLKETKFRCYQEELLVTVDSLLSTPPIESAKVDPTESRRLDILAGICLAPVLLRAFLDQSRKWDSQRLRDARMKTSTEEIRSLLQFKLFAFWAVRLQQIVMARLSSRHVIYAFRSLREALEQILLHDTYTPSHDEASGSQLAVLEGIASHIMTVGNQDQEFHGFPLLEDAIPMVGLLLQLNHLLIHDRAKQALSLCLQSGSAALRPLSVDVMVRFFDTYRMLRQQDFAFTAMLDILDTLCDQNELDRIQSLGSLLRDQLVEASIAAAVQACPLQQAREIMEACVTKIRIFVGHSTSSTADDCLFVVSDLVIVLARNIRVDRATSLEVSETCHVFVEGAINCLANALSMEMKGGSAGRLQNITLKLCAWMLELHGRCSFWLGTGTRIHIPKTVLDLLESVLPLNAKELDATICMDGFVLLGCHRLRQLHSEIYEQERLETEGQFEPGENRTMISEARGLASAIARGAMGSSRCEGLWSVIAENFMFWAHYAEEAHVLDFLKCMCNSLSLEPLDGVARERVIMRDHEIAKGLLWDAAFFEDTRVQLNFSFVALSSSLDFIVESLRVLSLDMGVQSVLAVLQPPKRSESAVGAFRPLSEPHIFLKKKLSLASNAKFISGWRNATQLVAVVAGLPLSTGIHCRSAECVELGCKLDFALRCLLSFEDLKPNRTIAALNGLRVYLSKIVRSFFQTSVDLEVTGKEHTALIVKFLAINSDSKMIGCRDHLYSGSGLLFRIIADVLMSSGKVVWLSKAFDDFVELYNPVSEAHRRDGLAFFGRHAVESIRMRCSSGVFETTKVALSPLLDSLWNLAKGNLMGEGEESLGSMLLISDLYRLGHRPPNTSDIEVRFESYCMRIIKSNNGDIGTLQAVVGSLVLLGPTTSSRDMILDLAIKANSSHSVLDAAFCTLVQLLPPKELRSTIQNILTTNATTKPSLRLVLALFRYLKNESQIQVLAEFGKQLLSSALTHINDTNSTAKTDAALAIVDNLVNRRDIVVFREFDLAIVLSRMTSVLALSNAEPASRIQSSTFTSCCTLLASMHQRYGRLLYACVPSVVSAYSALLQQAMYGPDANLWPRQFARVSELLAPHRDIYKKHVLGLVLAFVRGINTISLDRRDSLIPAVYCILDIMSKYEIQQLNASMDAKHRILLRTIYQGYQKVHSYSGQ
jgi:hypothetical protein